MPFCKTVLLIAASALTLGACVGLTPPHDAASLLMRSLHRSEIVGFLAGFGTTFAAVPDLLAMLRRRSCEGLNPRMVSIMAIFQIFRFARREQRT